MTNQQNQPEPTAQAEPIAQPEPQAQAPQPANAYESIIEQQQQQITALMEQTKMLNEQIVNLVNNGAQLGGKGAQQPQGIRSPSQQFNQPSLEGQEDFTLESLAKDIGKKPKRGQ